MTTRQFLALAALAAWTIAHVAAEPSQAADSAGTAAPLFFGSAEDAVKSASVLLTARDWATLSRYYDLSLTPGVQRGQLLDGSFFIDLSKSPTGPAAITRWHNPFTPGVTLVSAKALGEPSKLPCIWSASTMLSIDQGDGVVQRIVQEFRLIQTKEGFQFLPPAPTEASGRTGGKT